VHLRNKRKRAMGEKTGGQDILRENGRREGKRGTCTHQWKEGVKGGGTIAQSHTIRRGVNLEADKDGPRGQTENELEKGKASQNGKMKGRAGKVEEDRKESKKSSDEETKCGEEGARKKTPKKTPRIPKLKGGKRAPGNPKKWGGKKRNKKPRKKKKPQLSRKDELTKKD